MLYHVLFNMAFSAMHFIIQCAFHYGFWIYIISSPVATPEQGIILRRCLLLSSVDKSVIASQ